MQTNFSRSTYIEEQAKAINPKAFRLSSPTGFLRTHLQLKNIPGLDFDLRPEGDHIWLRLERLETSPPPPLPEHLKELIQASNDPFASHASLLIEQRQNSLALSDDRSVAAAANSGLTQDDWIARDADEVNEAAAPYDRQELTAEETPREYLSEIYQYQQEWLAWAEVEKPRRQSISLYGDLFALKHQIDAEETAKPQEFVWGIGVSTWQIPYGENTLTVEYPILTQALEIFIDNKSMAIEIRPRATETRAELDAFIACSIPGAAEVEQAIKEQLQRDKDRPVTPFDASSYSGILKLAASNLDGNGCYRELLASGDALPMPGANLVVTDGWVLLSRPRSNNYLVEDLKRLKSKLASGCAIPMGPLALVTPPSDRQIEYETIQFRGLSSRGSSDGKSQELFFPLPYNEEQVTIIQRLEKSAGVTVQGPPGTGKTHTIANVICHYLATGRRVLVTSRGEPALEVLQSKIPEEVRALTVALMASDREGVRQFQAAIEQIQHQVSHLNPELTRRQITELQTTIDRVHHELSAIDSRIDEIALAQLADIDVDGTPMRAQKLAELVISGAGQFGWFDDAITLASENAPPLPEDEAGQLRDARRKLGADLVYVSAKYPSADSLPASREIGELHATLSSMRLIEAEVERGNILELKASTADVIAMARELLRLIEESLSVIEEIELSNETWPSELRAKCRLEKFALERQALESLFTDIDALIEARAEFLKRPVEVSEAALNSAKTQEAIARAAETGKPFGLFAFGAAEVKELIATIKISGLSPTSKDDWLHVNRYLSLNEKVISLVSRWNNFADDLSLPKLQGSIAKLRGIEMTATLAKKTHRLATELDVKLPKLAESVFAEAPRKALLGNSADLQNVKAHISRHLTKAELAKATSQLNLVQEKLAGKTGPVSTALKAFIEHQLGNPDNPSERIVAQYAELIAELRRIDTLTTELTGVRDFAVRIERAGAPKLASRVLTQPVAMTGEDTVFPVTWRQAWNWARMRTYLDSIEARNELLGLAAKRTDLEGSLSRLYQDMVAKAAWLATKQNATPKILQALAGYAAAIRRIGQGTGPNATRYRRDARESMIDAAGAVPCWIMSHARISEAMPADIGAFDLVIVDEASQSDLWALPAILRGKKILVVGDDKQVSPEGGFISAQKIESLKTRFLAGQPYGNEMTPERSLYELASRVFAAQQVMLREHFRCVPPIIAYSNRVFYKGAIQPLRIPKASERIEPPLVDIYIPEGFRNKQDLNDHEAQAIADEIAAILKNDQFTGRTIGVVSLLGMEQAKYIDAVVRDRCDAAELLHRKFECGDARTFQGSERDIMFLSMVADKENCHALSRLGHEQRFNVAASRARDRMYLVRSVEASDLSEKDLRLTLLSHFNKPLISDTEEAELLIDRCESGFEREVFSILTSRGYRVIPQVKTGAYRIDMVVEGTGDNRLAIELDGDEFHNPDRWQHDMNRQRVLERVGWTFWRCFASTWSLRKDEVLDELLARLTAMSIEPMGAIQQAPAFVEKRVWMPKQHEVSQTSNE
ncbi:AAA domain-containing protein [Methylomicrobium sp. Wu6]|uniref:AAA domain-containing protein n=1 Tax=Methylomicrobium sp. Wu6 TaxID=3107928 RepID=UPI002DD677B0|nr:AAA domain-containing protein [Methylomicrobium sp. Wu6]MEC4748831.1 AAA domain-containing protein [Methylomicrobium sp. Wu6]